MSYSDIGALSVRLNLETNNFNKKIKTINKEIKHLEKDFKSAGKGVKNFENSFTGTSKKIALLNKQLELSKTKLKEQKKQMDSYSSALKKQKSILEQHAKTLGKSSPEYKKQKELVTQISAKMRSLGTAITETKGNIRAYSTSLSEAKQKMASITSTTQTFAQKLKVVQEESKLASSQFGAMMNTMKEGSTQRSAMEMKQLSSSIEHARKEASLYQSEITKLQSAQSRLTASQSKIKAEIKQTASALASAKSKYGESASQVQKLEAKLGSLRNKLQQTQSEHEANASAIRQHSTALNDLNGKIALTSKRLGAMPLETATKRFNTIGSTMTGVGASLTATVGLPLTLLGTTAVSTAMTFEESMSKVQAVTGATEEELEALEKQARQLGATTQFSASEASSAMAFLGQAGFSVNEVMESMPSQLALAKAGMLDLGETADITSNILTGFGLGTDQMAHVADVLAYAASNSNTNISQLGEAMTYLAPISNTLGLKIEDVTSAVMSLGDAGIQGSMAGRAFATSLANLADDGGKYAKALAEIGVSAVDDKGKFKELNVLITELQEGLDGMSESAKAAQLKKIFGADALKHWGVLLATETGTLKENKEALDECNGSAQKMADTMADNLSGSVKEMKSKLEDMAITVGYALQPTIQKATEVIGRLTEWFASLSPSMQNAIVNFGLLAVAVPLVTTALGFVISGFSSLGKVMGKLGGSIGKITPQMGGLGTTATKVGGIFSRITPLLLNPWTALAGAVAVGGVALYGFKKSCDTEFKEISKSAKNNLTGLGDYFESELPQKFETAVDQINSVEFFDDGTKGSLISSVNEIQKIMESGTGNLEGQVNQLVSTIGSNFDNIPKEMRESIVNGMAEFLSALYADGQIAENEFKGWIEQLQEIAKVEIEVDYEQLANKNQASLYFNTFTNNMQNVGSKMDKWGNDIKQTCDNVTDTLKQAQDLDEETLKQYTQSIAQFVSDIDMSKDDQEEIYRQMAKALSNSLDPSLASQMLADLSTAMGAGFQDIETIQSAFIHNFNTQEGALKADSARTYADFIKETGNFANLLSGQFGNISEVHGTFWSTFVNRIGENQEDVRQKSSDIIQAYMTELNKADSPEAVIGITQSMAQFVGALIESGALTQQEANKIVQGINAELGGIEADVSTTITANTEQFEAKELEVLNGLHNLNKTESVVKVNANNATAKKTFSDTVVQASNTAKQVESKVPKLKADGSGAQKEMANTLKYHGSTAKSIESNVTKLRADGSPMQKTIGEAKQKHSQMKSEVESKKTEIKAEASGFKGVVDSVLGWVKSIPSKISTTFSLTKKETTVKKTVPAEPVSASYGLSRMANVETPATVSTYNDEVQAISDSFKGVSRAVSDVNYNGSQYIAPVQVTATTSEKSRENEKLINAVHSLIDKFDNYSEQKTNVVEAQLYIDGKQLKSHMETIEKRQKRLRG